MAVGIVVIRPGLPGQPVTGKLTCDGTPSSTNINLGFVPSVFKIWNATDGDTSLEWTADMPAASGITDAGANVASAGITAVQQTDGTNHGVLVGTDASCQEASKVFNFVAFH